MTQLCISPGQISYLHRLHDWAYRGIHAIPYLEGHVAIVEIEIVLKNLLKFLHLHTDSVEVELNLFEFLRQRLTILLEYLEFLYLLVELFFIWFSFFEVRVNLVRLRSVPLNLLGDHFYLAHRLRYIAPHLGELQFDLVGFILEFER